MSFVGPRPLLIEYNNLYSKEQLRGLSVLPGITGWAQINGRNNISWEKKFDYDLWYIDNQSLPLDLIIICKTIVKSLLRKDILPEDGNPMPKFKGTKKLN